MGAWTLDKNTSEDWEFNVTGVAVAKDGTIYSLLVATDHEYFISYVKSQENIEASAKNLLEHEGWIYDIALTPAGELVAVGEDDSDPVFLRFNGKKWHKESIPNIKNPTRVRCIGEELLLLGEGVIAHRAASKVSGAWSILTKGWKTQFHDCCGQLGSLMAGGERGLLISEAQPKWKKIESKSTGNYLSLTSSNDENGLWAAMDPNSDDPGEKMKLIDLSGKESKFFATKHSSIPEIKFWRGALYAAAGSDGVLKVTTTQRDVVTTKVVNDNLKASSLDANESCLVAGGGMRVVAFDGKKWKTKVFEIK